MYFNDGESFYFSTGTYWIIYIQFIYISYTLHAYGTVYYIATVGHDLKPQRSKGRSIETSNRKGDYMILWLAGE